MSEGWGRTVISVDRCHAIPPMATKSIERVQRQPTREDLWWLSSTALACKRMNRMEVAGGRQRRIR
jgi:hypothetical protein